MSKLVSLRILTAYYDSKLPGFERKGQARQYMTRTYVPSNEEVAVLRIGYFGMRQSVTNRKPTRIA